VGRDCSEECQVEISQAWFTSRQGSKGAEKSTLLIHLPEQVFDPNVRHTSFDGLTEEPDPFWNFELILAFQT
jgi:hypothetical protein